MNAFNVTELVAARDFSVHTYSEFFRADLLSMGFAVWPAGDVDTQAPHAEDEVYYVVAGRGCIRVDGDDQPVGPGSIVYVAAEVEHQFHDIAETLQVLVFWAPPHHSRDSERRGRTG
jgi:mannose-6-phosphate isomerase-like protein (cupin superfamily)